MSVSARHDLAPHPHLAPHQQPCHITPPTEAASPTAKMIRPILAIVVLLLFREPVLATLFIAITVAKAATAYYQVLQ